MAVELPATSELRSSTKKGRLVIPFLTTLRITTWMAQILFAKKVKLGSTGKHPPYNPLKHYQHRNSAGSVFCYLNLC